MSMPRSIRLTLIASLVLNVLLGAALATSLALQTWHRGSDGAGHNLPSPRALGRHLHHEEKAVLRAILERRRAQFRQAGSNVLDARRRARQALTGEPFDSDALAAALADLHIGQGRLSAEAQAAMVELARELDADGRARLALALLVPERGRRGERARARDD